MNGNMELYNPNNELKKKKNAKKLQRTKTKKILPTSTAGIL